MSNCTCLVKSWDENEEILIENITYMRTDSNGTVIECADEGLSGFYSASDFYIDWVEGEIPRPSYIVQDSTNTRMLVTVTDASAVSDLDQIIEDAIAVAAAACGPCDNPLVEFASYLDDNGIEAEVKYDYQGDAEGAIAIRIPLQPE